MNTKQNAGYNFVSPITIGNSTNRFLSTFARMKRFFFLIFLLSVLLISCTPKTKQNETLPNDPQSIVVENNEWDDLMQQIDEQLPELTRIESLIYYKEDASSMEATAYLDQNNAITKIEQEATEGTTGYITHLHFYSKDGVRFATKRASVKESGENAYFSEEITFYSPDGIPTLSKERTAHFETAIENESFYAIDTVRHNDQEAFLILRQQGAYTTTFQGFVESGPFHFLIVGENTAENGYTASISIQEDSPTLRFLRGEGKKALGRALHVDFERYTAPTGYTMQILINVRLLELKPQDSSKNSEKQK